MKLKNCCFKLSLENGAKLISLLGIAQGIFFALFVGLRIIGDKPEDRVDTFVALLMHIAFCGMLWRGVVKGKPSLVLAYLVFVAIEVVFICVGLVKILMEVRETPEEGQAVTVKGFSKMQQQQENAAAHLSWIRDLIAIGNAVINIYFWAVVFCLWKRMKLQQKEEKESDANKVDVVEMREQIEKEKETAGKEPPCNQLVME